MVLVEVDAVVVLSTSVSAASGMLPVLANAAVAVADMAAQIACLLLVCAHDGRRAGEGRKGLYEYALRSV